MFRVGPESRNRNACLVSPKEGQNSLKRALGAQQDTSVFCDYGMHLGLGRWSRTWLGKLRQESFQHAS